MDFLIKEQMSKHNVSLLVKCCKNFLSILRVIYFSIFICKS